MECENLVKLDLVEVLNTLRKKEEENSNQSQLTSEKVWEKFISSQFILSEEVQNFTDYQASVISFIMISLMKNPQDTLSALAAKTNENKSLYDSFKDIFICNMQTQEYFFYINTLRNAIETTKKYLGVLAVNG